MCICCSFVLIVYCAFMSLNAVNLVCAFKNVKAQQGLEISFRNKSLVQHVSFMLFFGTSSNCIVPNK